MHQELDISLKMVFFNLKTCSSILTLQELSFIKIPRVHAKASKRDKEDKND
jgi:hypothetical protein